MGLAPTGKCQGSAWHLISITALATQGTLPPVRSSWHNELHPSNDGYDLFVDLFRKKLKELFPGRVL